LISSVILDEVKDSYPLPCRSKLRNRQSIFPHPIRRGFPFSELRSRLPRVNRGDAHRLKVLSIASRDRHAMNERGGGDDRVTI